MTQNKRTSGVGAPKALENVCCNADHSRDTAQSTYLQASRLTQRFKFSPAVAATIATLAYGIPETWSARP